MNRFRVLTLVVSVVLLIGVLLIGSGNTTALQPDTSVVATDDLTWIDLGQVLPDGTAINAITSTPGGQIVGGSAVSPVMLFGYDIAAGANRQKATTFAVGVLMPRDSSAVYVGTLAIGAQGHLWAYTPSTDSLVDLGQINAEYAQGLTIGRDGKVYVAACCNGAFSVYDPATASWDYNGQIVAGQRRLSALATAADGMIYGTTSRIWTTPAGGAVLYKYDPATDVDTILHTISPGLRESWNLLYNPLDQRLYGSVSYQMVPRLFVYDPQQPALGIQDLGAVGTTSGDLLPGEMAIAPDGKVYVKASGSLYRFDPARPGDGLVFMSAGVPGRMAFGADGYLYRMLDRRLLRSAGPLSPPASSIFGHVRDQNGAGLADVNVCTQTGVCATTDGNGAGRGHSRRDSSALWH